MPLIPCASLTPVIAIDLATRRYRDIGIAVLTQTEHAIDVRFVRPTAHGLTGVPEVAQLADFVTTLAQTVGASVIAIDGPQAWKDPDNGLLHSRVSERLLHTQSKAGLPGFCKPGTGLRFVNFAIALFDQFASQGWSRLAGPITSPTTTGHAVEIFPTATWRALGCKPLPSKQATQTGDIDAWLQRLQTLRPLTLESAPSHDELQALVGGLAALALVQGETVGAQLVGRPPFQLDGIWREGYIVNLGEPVLRDKEEHNAKNDG